jgi:[calcium/calmodulin-dependent protein kinase] kinase
MKAVNKFKSLLNRRRPYLMNSILGQGTRMVQPPLAIDKDIPSATRTKARSVDVHDRKPIDGALVMEGVHRETEPHMMNKSAPSREDGAAVESPKSKGSADKCLPGERLPTLKRALSGQPEEHRSREGTLAIDIPNRQDSARGHAHDPLEDYLFLDIGPEGTDEPHDPPAVAESPPATDVNIYETAYHEEIERIRAEKGRQATLYLTRRVDGRKEYQKDENLQGLKKEHTKEPTGFAKLLQNVKEKHEAELQQQRDDEDTTEGE